MVSCVRSFAGIISKPYRVIIPVVLNKQHGRLSYNIFAMHPHKILKEMITPSAGGIAAYIFVTFALLIFSHPEHLLHRLGTPDTTPYFEAVIRDYSQATFSWLDKSTFLGLATLFLLWASIGAIIYMSLWILLNWYIGVHNAIVIGTTYTTIDTHGHAAYWKEIIARAIFRVCGVVLVLSLASVAVQWWYPISTAMFDLWLNNVKLLANWALLGKAIVGWLIIWHLSVIFMRFTFLRPRIFG